MSHRLLISHLFFKFPSVRTKIKVDYLDLLMMTMMLLKFLSNFVLSELYMLTCYTTQNPIGTFCWWWCTIVRDTCKIQYLTYVIISYFIRFLTKMFVEKNGFHPWMCVDSWNMVEKRMKQKKIESAFLKDSFYFFYHLWTFQG